VQACAQRAADSAFRQVARLTERRAISLRSVPGYVAGTLRVVVPRLRRFSIRQENADYFAAGDRSHPLFPSRMSFSRNSTTSLIVTK